jgi:[acyl-carrier-protein] S-malonyltransferase
MNNAILCFPGQGCQTLNMGKVFYDNHKIYRDVIEECSDAINIDIAKIIFGDDAEALTSTENAQVAIMATCFGGYLIAKNTEELSFQYLAGHSLGEYTALVVGGVISLKDAANLLYKRGTFMKNAAIGKSGKMLAVIGQNFDSLYKYMEELNHDFLSDNLSIDVANSNSASQIVVSGSERLINLVVEFASLNKLRAIMLNVSAPFHSRLIKDACANMKSALAAVEFKEPIVPIITNMTASKQTDPQIIKNDLVPQISNTVRWHESMIYAQSQNIDTMIEVGPAKVLTNLAKKDNLFANLKNIVCE